MILYSRSGNGEVLVWGIDMTDLLDLEIEWGQLNGSVQTKTIIVEENQSGRDLYDQCELEMNQRISRKKQQGYTEDIPEAGSKITNALGLPKPMLAQKYKGQTIDTGPGTMFTQPKLDGNRCIIRITPEGLIEPYTRNGKHLYNMEHIVEDIEQFVPPVDDIFLDGELYCHGESLQTIVSWIKREQENTKKIKFMCYDVIMDEQYSIRYKTLKEFFSRNFSTMELVKTMEHNYIDSEVAKTIMMEHREQGYEGAIIRYGVKGYEDGKRSTSLLKVKHWKDGEFKIVDVRVTKDGFGVFVCQMDTGNGFKCNPPGNFDFRYYVANSPRDFIGKFVTVEYANLTKDGIPFHPIAKCMVEHKEV